MDHRRSGTLLFLLISLSLHAQFPFSELYYQGDPSPYTLNGQRFALRADGRPVLMCSGDTLHFNGLGTDGQVEWTSAIAKPMGYELVLSDVLPFNDGTLAACGFIYQPAPEVGLYLHVDTLGNVLSAKTYHLDFNTRLFAMAANADGSVRMTGYRQTALPPDYTGVVLDVDTGGNVLSTSLISIGGHSTLPNALIGTMDGGHVMIGESWLLNSSGLVLYKTAHIAKLDSAGHVQWARREQASSLRTYPQGVVQAGNGDIVYAMRAESQQGDKLILVTYGPGGNVVHQVRIDPEAPSNGYLAAAACSLQGDSILVLSGFTNLVSDMFTLRIDTGLNNPELLLRDPVPGEWIGDQVILPDGSILQAASAASPNSGTCVMINGLTPDGLSVCTNTPCAVGLGTPELLTTPTFVQNPASPTVVDVSDLFQAATITLLNMPACLSTGSIGSGPRPSVQLAPNPAQDGLRISAAAIGQVTLLDAMGRVVVTRTFQGQSSVDLDLRGLIPGLYLARIQCAEGSIVRQVIKE